MCEILFVLLTQTKKKIAKIGNVNERCQRCPLVLMTFAEMIKTLQVTQALRRSEQSSMPLKSRAA